MSDFIGFVEKHIREFDHERPVSCELLRQCIKTIALLGKGKERLRELLSREQSENIALRDRNEKLTGQLKKALQEIAEQKNRGDKMKADVKILSCEYDRVLSVNLRLITRATDMIQERDVENQQLREQLGMPIDPAKAADLRAAEIAKLRDESFCWGANRHDATG